MFGSFSSWLAPRRGGFGYFGTDLATARRSEFFGFFHLVESDRPEAASAGVVFRPESPDLRRLVSLRVALKAGRIVALELHVRREFIDDPERYPFAADVTSSFMRAALREVRSPAALQASQDIGRYRPPYATARVFVRSPELGPSPTLGSSAQVAVYAGHAPACESVFGRFSVRLANMTHDGEPTLLVEVARAAATGGWPRTPGRIDLVARLGRRWAAGVTRAAPAATDPSATALIALVRRLNADPFLRDRFSNDPHDVLRAGGVDPERLGLPTPIFHADVPRFLRRTAAATAGFEEPPPQPPPGP